MKHFVIVLASVFLILPTSTFAVGFGKTCRSTPDCDAGLSCWMTELGNGTCDFSDGTSKAGLCQTCYGVNPAGPNNCESGLVCKGDINQPDKPGYCQYADASKVALCNPLKSSTIGDLIKRLSDFVFNVALVLTPVLILYAGFLFLTSAGDPKQVSAAKNIILWTVIGLGVILLSKGIVAIMKGLLGI